MNRSVRSPHGWHLLCAIAMSIAAPLQGQDADLEDATTPAGSRNWYSLRQWSVRRGLPQVSVRALLRDHCGNLWFGTEAGPGRFDGEEFQRPNYGALPDIPVRTCTDLAQFGYLEIAALTSVGEILLIDAIDIDRIHQPAELTEFLRTHRVRRIARFGKRHLAFGTDQGLFRWAAGEHPTPIEPLSSQRILTVERGRRDSLWVGTPDGAYHVRAEIEVDRIEGLRGVLCFDARESHTWVGTSEGLHRLDDAHHLVAGPDSGLPGGLCRDVATLPNGDVAILTEDHTVQILVGGGAGRTSFPIAQHLHALCLLGSATDDALWIGSLENGLARAAKQPMRRRHVPNGRGINNAPGAVFLTGDGQLWVGTQGHGLLRSTPESVRALEQAPGRPSASVLAFLEDDDGTLLLGCSDGLARWNGTEVVAVESRTVDASVLVRAIARDAEGTPWLGTDQGLFRRAADDWVHVPAEGEDTSPRIWCLELDGARLLAGARSGGVFAIEAGRVARIQLGESFDTASVSSICRIDDALWLGCLGGRIVRWTAEGCEDLRVSDQILPINILGLGHLGDGVLWASATSGLLSFDTRADGAPLRRYLRPPAAGEVMEFNGHSDFAMACDPAGRRLFVPGVGGVIEVDADRFDQPDRLPEPWLSAAHVDGSRSSTIEGRLEVPAGSRRIEIAYQNPVLGSAESISYRHRLTGFDDRWTMPTRRTTAVFTDLRPGDYVFECELGTPAAWSGAVTRLPIRVLPSLTERLDFRLALLALAGIATALGLRAFGRGQRRRARELENQVALRTAALAEQVQLKETAEAALRSSHDELDAKVRARTAELESAHQQLVQAQKLESVARLAGGLAHDLNNLLTAILGFAETAGEELPAQSPGRSDIAEIRRAGDRAAHLVQQLLTFARPQPTRSRVVTVSDLVSELEPMLVGLLRPDRQLVVEACTCPCTVLADRVQLEQVITNLVVNARDATPRGGPPIRLAVGRDYETDEIWIEVADQGAGITPDNLSRIFDPFFTTREEGTGLGLSVCHGIVQRHGGRILVDSEPGVGSTFRVVLPRVEPVEVADTGHGATPRDLLPVLVVDDQPPVRTMMERSLRRAGFEVIAAESLETALDAVAGRELLGVVTDVSMPGGTGDELVARLRKQHPEVPALFVSGFAPQMELLEAQNDRTRLLSKPFGPEELIRNFRELLAAGQAPPG